MCKGINTKIHTLDQLQVYCELIFEESIIPQLWKNPQVASEPNLTQTAVGFFTEYTLNTVSTNFSIMIPPLAPASFSTDLGILFKDSLVNLYKFL